ncbi:MAG: methanogenesis marker 7 protein [Methanocalculus sp. MSAO_Arc1]|uniref:methanogenesis marker 7 protein n=1 Tax=Methanocalculus TaxID=71151 RepID=UPI000FF2A467|nr:MULTISPECIES: methanogenesis marker 7 protein [unclassified Methanocalculus]MCP1662727.1 putative methanogenesis marker protein 7 [Methanocalculus sp. AMF5]RQD79961.1 MAG: methanogenesis marker 7 protein [Methanocalculus sp. MSAO_Arc1]
MILVPITYTGGIYRHDEVVDYIEDLGGYIIQKHDIAQEIVLQVLIPKDDISRFTEFTRPLAGEVSESPLVGTEIAVVIPSLEIHHLPHSACDIAEYLRTVGAKTNMVGLARGFGKRIAQLNDEERDVINEHDCAVYVLGNFETCIEQKFDTLRRGVHVPIILTGAPPEEALRRITDPPAAGYVGNLGRFMHRTRTEADIGRLDAVVDEVARVLNVTRDEIAKDPLSVSPARLKEVIEEQVPEIHEVYSPTPLTVQLAGLRIKLPFDRYAATIKKLTLEEGVLLGDVARIRPSRMRDYILVQVKPFSETHIVV